MPMSLLLSQWTEPTHATVDPRSADLFARRTKGRELAIPPVKKPCSRRSTIYMAPWKKAGALVTHEPLPLSWRTICNWFSYFKTWSAMPSSTKGQESPGYTSPPPRMVGRNGYFLFKTTDWELTRSTSKGFLACSSGCTNGTSSRHGDWIGHL